MTASGGTDRGAQVTEPTIPVTKETTIRVRVDDAMRPGSFTSDDMSSFYKKMIYCEKISARYRLPTKTNWLRHEEMLKKHWKLRNLPLGNCEMICVHLNKSSRPKRSFS
jgi:hypothetical protein